MSWSFQVTTLHGLGDKHVTIGVNSSESICRIGPIIRYHEIRRQSIGRTERIQARQRMSTLDTAGVKVFLGPFSESPGSRQYDRMRRPDYLILLTAKTEWLHRQIQKVYAMAH